MAINRDIRTTGPDGIPVPTYGNYGGPLYSDGHVLSSENETVDYSSPPVDTLDGLFLLHDRAYDEGDPNLRAAADLALVRATAALPEEATSADARLYGGGAVLFGLLQMSEVNGRPDLVDREEATALAARAFEMIASGIAHSSPEDRAAFEAYAVDAAPYVADAATERFSSAWSAAEPAVSAAEDALAAAATDALAFATSSVSDLRADLVSSGGWDFV